MKIRLRLNRFAVRTNQLNTWITASIEDTLSCVKHLVVDVVFTNYKIAVSVIRLVTIYVMDYCAFG